MSLAGKLGRLLLAVALLAGWQAALEHPVRHVDEHGGFVHGSQDQGGAAQLACDAIAAVAAVIGGAAPALSCPHSGAERIASHVFSPASPAFVSPSSRDPPALL